MQFPEEIGLSTVIKKQEAAAYYAESRTEISTDGSEREDLGKLVDKDTITDGGQSIVWTMHRGYIYYVYQLAVQAEDTYYLNNSNCVYIMKQTAPCTDLTRKQVSRDGRHLADMEFSSAGIIGDEGRIRGLAGSDEERIYISCILKDEENIYDIPIMGMPVVIEYIEKDDIQDGGGELKEWSEMGAKSEN